MLARRQVVDVDRAQPLGRAAHEPVTLRTESLGLPIADTEVPLTAAFQNAAAERRPLLAWRPDSAGALAYWRLARELSDDEPRAA